MVDIESRLSPDFHGVQHEERTPGNRRPARANGWHVNVFVLLFAPGLLGGRGGVAGRACQLMFPFGAKVSQLQQLCVCAMHV